MTTLTTKHCAACEGKVPALDAAQIAALAPEVPQWTAEAGRLVRTVTRKNFLEALALLNRIAELAEVEQHHPDLLLHGWKHLTVTLSTHAVGGLTENDFILAAKIDQLL